MQPVRLAGPVVKPRLGSAAEEEADVDEDGAGQARRDFEPDGRVGIVGRSEDEAAV